MKILIVVTTLLAAFSGANACGAECQVGVSSGMSDYLYGQFANGVAEIYTKISAACASTAGAAPALAELKTTLATAVNATYPNFYTVVHNAVFKKYHGLCIDVGLLCGNPVAVYYNASDALVVAQGAAQNIVTPFVGTIPQLCTEAITKAGADGPASTALNAAIKSNVPADITMKYVPSWIPDIQGDVVRWP